MKKAISALVITAMLSINVSAFADHGHGGYDHDHGGYDHGGYNHSNDRDDNTVIAIILGATVAMSAISAFDHTTNGDRANYARMGVLDINKEAMDYLATNEAGPSLLKAYEFTNARSAQKLSLDQYAETFVAHSSEIEAATVAAAQQN